jgi:hypothetical protein
MSDGNKLRRSRSLLWRYRCRHHTGQPSRRAHEIVGNGGYRDRREDGEDSYPANTSSAGR